MNRHITVLLNECIDAFILSKTPYPVFVDCTLGGAGHTAELLRTYPNCRVLACDLDDSAITAAGARLPQEVEEGRLVFYHGNFADLARKDVQAKLPHAFEPPWDGILMDLGFSSNQLENPDFGMSFGLDAPLDMRLSRPPVGSSAWELLQISRAEELAEILRAYGEMSGAGRLARMIKEGTESGEVKNSTLSLASFLSRVSKSKDRNAIHPATLVFQALRIAVNDELRVLDTFLQHAILCLKPGGRIAIISFHSLEDRIVKRWGQTHGDQLMAVTKKPIQAKEEELRDNPRARSAKLRIYART